MIPRLVSELRRRHVFRITSVYAIVAFLIWQVADLVVPALALPVWTNTFVIIVAILGFPIALVLAWAYELTPLGLQRDNIAVEGGAPRSPPPLRSRIAVLPFANISPNAGDEYFADGMTEELISRLSRIHGLDVIARTSVMGYKEQRKTISAIAQELAVGSVLEGSVRRAGNHVRITVQLIDCETSGHLWSEDYDRELRDVFTIQTDIANCVAHCLTERLAPADYDVSPNVPTPDLAAYDLYLLGRYYWNKHTDAGIRTAISYFEQAVAKDPQFGAAYAGLADAYTFASIGYLAQPPADAAEKALGYARKSLELVETSPDAHASLGFITFIYEWDWAAGERELRRALDLNPSHELANRWYAWTRIGVRDFNAAFDAFQRVLELNPRSPIALTEMGWPYSYVGDHTRGKEWYEKALTVDSNYLLARYDLAWSFSKLGQLEEAIREYQRALAISGGAPFVHAGLATVLTKIGRRQEAQATLDSLLKIARGGARIWLWVAVVQEALGETGAALTSLEQAFDTHELMAFIAGTEWLPFESLRNQPKFQLLIERLHLPVIAVDHDHSATPSHNALFGQ